MSSTTSRNSDTASCKPSAGRGSTHGQILIASVRNGVLMGEAYWRTCKQLRSLSLCALQ